jgi:phosphinothricin acetyltransferase
MLPPAQRASAPPANHSGMTSGIAIVDGLPEHLSAIAEIYAGAVAEGPATFDLEAPSPAWWRGVLDATDTSRGHMLLAALGEGGGVVGYAKSAAFRPKAAYASTCETSVYVAADARGRGVGDALYTELFDRLDRSGLRLAVAGVTTPNAASAQLHRTHGFTTVGTFAGVGVKFGQPWDVTWYQRPLRSAVLLDALGAAARAAATRSEALPELAAAFGREVALFDAVGDGLRSVNGDAAAPAAVDHAVLAPGRPVLVANGDGQPRALAPVLAPGSGAVLGALVTEAASDRDFDGLDEGLLARCAEMLVPLWTCG